MAFIRNGFSTQISLSALAFTATVVEKTVTPPGIEGGGPINITNMRNLRWRTQVPKSLLTLKNLLLTVQYDPAFYGAHPAVMQVIQLVTIQFPDASTLVFWGWMEDITPQELKEGEEPLANWVICPSLYHNGTEVAPVYAAA